VHWRDLFISPTNRTGATEKGEILEKSFVRLHFPNINKKGPNVSGDLRRIPAELPRSSYEEGSREAGRPYGPQSLITLSTRLCLAITLGMGALQVEARKCGVCVDFHW
jgi:hypothetical protein